MLREMGDVEKASERAGSNMAFLSLWDMGGHVPFQATHNVFISSHGIYLLVFRLTDLFKHKTETDRLKKWIRMIGTFSAVEYNAPKLKEHHPPIIFVGTFLDELKKTFPDYDRKIAEIKLSISKFPEISCHKYVRFCAIDNSLEKHQGDGNLEKLRKKIVDLAEYQDQWGRELPSKWLQLEMDLLKIRKQGTKVLTLTEVEEMNLKSIAPLDDMEEIKLALEYLHCTRSLIYFREIDSIIIDPQFLVDFFSVLITDTEFLSNDDLKVVEDLELYKENGELTPELINSLLCREKTKAFLPHLSHLLALMEKFGLIVKMQIPESTTGHVRFSETYTVPSKLVELPDISTISECVKGRVVSRSLCFIFKDVFVPEELFHRVFATVLRSFKTASLSRQNLKEVHTTNATTEKETCLFRGFGLFEINDLYSMILSMHWERSAIAVTLLSPTQPELPQDSGCHVRERVERILQEMLQMSCQQHFQYTYNLHCNFHLNPYDTPLDLFSVFKAKEGLPCKGEECRGKHRLTQSDVLFWGLSDEACTPSQRLNSDGEDAHLDRRPTPRELGRLSYVVEATKCSLLFIELGLSMPDITNIEHDARALAAETKITRMFLMWTCSYPNHTFRHIENAMRNSQINWDSLGRAIETGWESVTLDEMESNEDLLRPLTVSETKGILSHIGKKYFNLFLELELSVSAIEKCELDYPVAERRFEALIKLWIKTFQDQATIIRVLKAMKVCKMNWHDTAMEYCGARHAAQEGKKCCNIL
ncbi:uncharacterized protein LOC117321163 [Pecten maximus]|uniref:uncharacterized protein LOC117321163 n=1 Tax=Pecten maximus TaxID=6579 RepID=UPI001458BFB9|nr:uncharacterized protein LOC117321163 [Pecten maximus]